MSLAPLLYGKPLTTPERELYHLKDDPQEKNDLAKAKPAVFTNLAQALSRHIQRGGATPWQAPKK